MKQFINGPSMPTAQICINKSRLKVYNKESLPTYYLQKGTEFQIELFNPTSDTILAKIYLNNKKISQGGLVLRPGERVFLERYLDVAKKFLFDTYEVANTSEVQKAIEENGDFKVEFFKEIQPQQYRYTGTGTFTLYKSGFPVSGGIPINTYTTSYKGSATSANITNTNITNTSYNLTFDPADFYMPSRSLADTESLAPKKRMKASNKIETGRVEAGSNSNQQIQTVNKSFDYYPFHVTEYKLLPLSQKVNTLSDINVKRYCHNCGAKQKPEFKFCPSCGKKC